jgi:hypothetical protein
MTLLRRGNCQLQLAGVANFLWYSFLVSSSGWHSYDVKNGRGSCHHKVKKASHVFFPSRSH